MSKAMSATSELMTARQRVLSGNRRNWRVGNLIAFQHGPDRRNVYRFRVTELGPNGMVTRMELTNPTTERNPET